MTGNVTDYNYRLCFKVAGQQLEAIRIRPRGVLLLPASEVLEQADNRHILHTKEDWEFIFSHRDSLPLELRGPRLATGFKAKESGFDRSVWGLVYRDWDERCNSLPKPRWQATRMYLAESYYWDSELVLRRIPSDE